MQQKQSSSMLVDEGGFRSTNGKPGKDLSNMTLSRGSPAR